MQEIDTSFYSEYDLTVSAIHAERTHEFKAPPNWKYEENDGRSIHGLVFILDGSAIYITKENSFTVKKDEILFIPKGSKYVTHGSAAPPYHHIVISFDVEDHNTLTFALPKEVIKPANQAYFKNLFNEFAATWQNKDIAYKFKCKIILQNIIYNLIVDFLKNQSHYKNLHKIYKSVKYIEENFDKNIIIDELAAMSHLSVTHFRRLFNQVYSMSPVEYLTMIRINKAKDLILSNKYTISEISEKVGYPYVCYFSRIFKKHTGVAPTAYKYKM
jgi:AraC-like DNA-binding protein